MPDNFFALLDDGSVRRITLLRSIENSIRDVFMNYGPGLLEGKEEVEFDGNYKVDEDEIMYVIMNLPDSFAEIANNPIGIPILDLENEPVKALFWFERNVYYFQNFDNRKMLRHRNVIFYNNQTFDKLTQDAFVVDNAVNAAYKRGKFLFLSYPNANKMFSLADFYKEATNEELTDFSEHDNVSISDPDWFLESNTVIRKQVTLLQKSKLLDGADTRKIKKSAKKFNVIVELDEDEKIVFPKDKKACKEILFFLNENYYEGIISKKHYRTNSKKVVNG